MRGTVLGVAVGVFLGCISSPRAANDGEALKLACERFRLSGGEAEIKRLADEAERLSRRGRRTGDVDGKLGEEWRLVDMQLGTLRIVRGVACGGHSLLAPEGTP